MDPERVISNVILWLVAAANPVRLLVFFRLPYCFSYLFRQFGPKGRPRYVRDRQYRNIILKDLPSGLVEYSLSLATVLRVPRL